MTVLYKLMFNLKQITAKIILLHLAERDNHKHTVQVLILISRAAITLWARNPN